MSSRAILLQLYCILFLHQTTTSVVPLISSERCIASSFYIKPQHARNSCAAYSSCIASSFYIKPQHALALQKRYYCCIASSFYIKPQQKRSRRIRRRCCIASSFYIKPQPDNNIRSNTKRCIASSFYIKPQPRTPDTLIFGHLTASRHDTKRGGVHRGSRFDAVFTFSTNIRKIIFTEIRRCMSVQRAGARLRSDSSEANI